MTAGGVETQTLMLTQSYEPIRLVSWQRAMTLLMLGKVEMLREYDSVIRCHTRVVPRPAVVRLLRSFRRHRHPVRFSRVNLFTRDSYCCQYCGAAGTPTELTYDHVVPRHMGGRTEWTNIVTACAPCNLRKGGRTPEQAGMRLLSRPVQPQNFAAVAVASVSKLGRVVPEPWRDFIL